MNVSFKITVFAKNKRKDNTYPVNIRIGYKSKYANIDTGFSAGATEINKKGEVKNGFIVDMCDKKIGEYKDKIRKIELAENAHILTQINNVQDLKKILLEEKIGGAELDFIGIFRDYLDANNELGGIGAYKTTYNHLTAFAGVSLLVNDITPERLRGFEKYLKTVKNKWGKTMGSRGVNLYMNAVRTVYNWMMDEYIYKGYQFIYPFRAYKVPPAMYEVRDFCNVLTKEQLRAIIEVPLTGVQETRARDLFIISLLTLGTNAKDLYQLEKVGKRVEYKRAKTRGRRKDGAFISIDVQPELKPYIAKYWGSIGDRPFAQLYASPSTLNSTIRLGLNQLVIKVNKIYGEGFLPDITFYDARRTMASVMANVLDISNDDIARCLNHVDERNVTARSYVARAFELINKRNRQFIDWLFAD